MHNFFYFFYVSFMSAATHARFFIFVMSHTREQEQRHT